MMGAVEPAGGAIRTQLDKILASKAFAQSDRMRRFLRLAVGYALEGRAGELKEYLLGVEVFDRKPSYDPRIDPIVRVEARRLRATLDKYYESEGRGDPVRIEFPKGSYAPLFRPAERVEPARDQPAEAKTVAVLPFANVSADPGNEYFSDGLTEELITMLAKVPGLRVVSRTSAFQFKGTALDVRRIGQQLNAEVVLEGSVRKSGERLRITVQLTSVRDGYHLWSETYDREMKDIFVIQEEISRAIVQALRIRLAETPAPRATRTLEAYNLYLKGRHLLNRRTEEALKRGVELLRQAVAEDPDYAPAHAGLADGYMLLGSYGVSPPHEVMGKAKAAALRALELDGGLAEAHASLGSISAGYEWDWAASERHFRRAFELNPRYATAHHWYAEDCLAPQGRMEEALVEIRVALELDPLSLILNTTAAWLLYLAGDYDRALAQYRSSLELDPNFYRAHVGLAGVYLETGMYAEAAAAAATAAGLSGGGHRSLATLAECFARAGRPREARQLLAELLEMAALRYVRATEIARVFTALSEYDSAFEWLDRACEARDSNLVWVSLSPSYRPLRSDPRFAALLRRIGPAP